MMRWAGPVFHIGKTTFLPENLKGRDYLEEKSIDETVTEMSIRRYFW
jgi:hypothetical protein